jgi:hypothetical protein
MVDVVRDSAFIGTSALKWRIRCDLKEFSENWCDKTHERASSVGTYPPTQSSLRCSANFESVMRGRHG